MMPLWYYETKNAFGEWAPHTTDDIAMIPKGSRRSIVVNDLMLGQSLTTIRKWAGVMFANASVPTSGEENQKLELLVDPPEDDVVEYVGRDALVPLSVEDAAHFLLAALRREPSCREVSLAITKVQEAMHWFRDVPKPDDDPA
jgi:hypothetical protein